MDSFLPRGQQWPPGETHWRVCALPDRDRDVELFDLIDKARKVFSGFPGAVVGVPEAHLNALDSQTCPAAAEPNSHTAAHPHRIKTRKGARACAIPDTPSLPGSNISAARCDERSPQPNDAPTSSLARRRPGHRTRSARAPRRQRSGPEQHVGATRAAYRGRSAAPPLPTAPILQGRPPGSDPLSPDRASPILAGRAAPGPAPAGP